MSRAVLLPALLGLSLGLGLGCFEDPNPGNGNDDVVCPDGQPGCPCGPGDSCDPGLECVEGTCGEAGGESGSTTGDTDSSSDSDDGSTGSSTDTSGDGSTDSSTDTDTAADTDTGLPPGACLGPEDCSDEEFCDFPDDQCGDLALGECAPRPDIDSCPQGFEVTGCDCQTYPGSCEARAMGQDFKCNGECC